MAKKAYSPKGKKQAIGGVRRKQVTVVPMLYTYLDIMMRLPFVVGTHVVVFRFVALDIDIPSKLIIMTE